MFFGVLIDGAFTGALFGYGVAQVLLRRRLGEDASVLLATMLGLAVSGCAAFLALVLVHTSWADTWVKEPRATTLAISGMAYLGLLAAQHDRPRLPTWSAGIAAVLAASLFTIRLSAKWAPWLPSEYSRCMCFRLSAFPVDLYLCAVASAYVTVMAAVLWWRRATAAPEEPRCACPR